MKKLRRHAQYEDQDGGLHRVYKHIVPAPPRELESSSSVAVAVNLPVESRGSKRKREGEIVSTDGSAPSGILPLPETERRIEPKRDFDRATRYPEPSRISISSLLTVDQSTTTPCVSQQSLNTYILKHHSSPLEDPILFYAFRHFVEVVAPTMSLIETSPPNPSILNYHAIMNMKACNLFTYQLPVMAISGNGPIMEAILAISFLHLSHITRSSKQQAFSHYQHALQRLRIESSKTNAGRDLGLLAATLLLAWYELSTGDHVCPSNARLMIVEMGGAYDWRDGLAD